MLNKNHIIVNLSSLPFLAYGSMRLFLDAKPENFYIYMREGLITLSDHIYYSYSWPLGIYIAVALFLYLLGSIFPDIDNPNSMLGRYVYIPLGARKLTHTLWVLLILLLVVVYLVPIVFWFLLGYFFHIFWDSLSKCGICWLYPLTKYREYNNGAKIKKGHKFYLYKVGSPMEYLIVGICISGGIWSFIQIIKLWEYL